MAIDDLIPAGACPYCQSENPCAHLLLTVDLTFRSAGSGVLYKKFEDRWAAICESHSENDDFDEGDAFDALLEGVSSLSDMEINWDFEGGPGMSSSYQAFYCKDTKAVDQAVSAYVINDEKEGSR